MLASAVKLKDNNNLNIMKELIPVITVFVSGFFGLLVALITWTLANKREKYKFLKEICYRDFKDMENYYLSSLASFDKSIRYTKFGKDYSEMIDELTMNSARTNVYGSKKVNDKLVEASEKLYEWSSEFRKSLPKRFGDTDLAVVSSENFKCRDNADNLYPELIQSLQELTLLIRQELKELKKEIEK
jgi:hypothetical protein